MFETDAQPKLIGYCKQHRTTDFRIRLIRDERETYLIALVCD